MKSKIESFIWNKIKENKDLELVECFFCMYPDRFDLAFKIAYLDGWLNKKKSVFYKELYIEHIDAFSLGKFIEPGNPNKSKLKHFLDEFERIFFSIKNNGFNPDDSLIPLSVDMIPLNGAHRVSSLIFLKKSGVAVKTPLQTEVYDYEFFEKRGVAGKYMDFAAKQYMLFEKDVHVAFLWPAGKFKGDIKQFFNGVFYRKKIKLNENGAHNLLSILYRGQDWLGAREKNFPGVKNKLLKCFLEFSDFEVVFFKEENLNLVLERKGKFRNVCGIGKDSIHITDSYEEAIEAAEMVLNDNSIHFLNFAKPNKFLNFHEKLSKIKNEISINKISSDDFLLDGGMVLEAYGLRKASDIDYLALENSLDKSLADCHNEEYLKYRKDIDINEMIYNPENFFYFCGFKFSSIENLIKLKKNRASNKDLLDVRLVADFISGKGKFLTKKIYLFRKYKYRFKEALKKLIVRLLRAVSLLEAAKKIRDIVEEKYK